jgi:hypothetical protein
MVSKFFRPLVDISIDTLNDVSDVLASLKTVVFVATLFRFVAKVFDAKMKEDPSVDVIDVVRANVDDCVALFRAVLLTQFLIKDDAQMTQAGVVALQHILLVCPELRELALDLKVP